MMNKIHHPKPWRIKIATNYTTDRNKSMCAHTHTHTQKHTHPKRHPTGRLPSCPLWWLRMWLSLPWTTSRWPHTCTVKHSLLASVSCGCLPTSRVSLSFNTLIWKSLKPSTIPVKAQKWHSESTKESWNQNHLSQDNLFVFANIICFLLCSSDFRQSMYLLNITST